MLQHIQRLFKHAWFDRVYVARTIPTAMQLRLAQQVATSELHHTGQIRICVEGGLPASYLWRKASIQRLTRQRALMLFSKLQVWDTANNNGVLIYLLLAEHAIEVVADRGLRAHVGPADWAAMVQRLGAALQDGHFEQGLGGAIDEVSATLVAHFPASAGVANPNELPDKVVLL